MKQWSNEVLMSVSSNLEFNNLLIKAAQENVSDLHLSVGSEPRARIGADLKDWSSGVITQEYLEENILKKLNQNQKDFFNQQKSLTFCQNFSDNLRFRISLFHQENKPSAVLRFIPQKIKSIEELGLPKIVETVANANRGLVLVSGLSGAGKTTTIASAIEHINQRQNKSIITVEKSIEYQHVNQKSLIEQREVGPDTISFSKASADLLNSDVNVIYFSYLPDEKTAINILELSQQALVFLEITSSSIIDSLSDFLSVFNSDIKEEKRIILSKNLIAVLNQILVKRQGGHLLPVMEIMLASNAIATAIAENRFQRIYDIITTSGHEGMITKERSLAELVLKGQVLLDEALKYVENKEEFKQMVLK